MMTSLRPSTSPILLPPPTYPPPRSIFYLMDLLVLTQLTALL